MRREPTEEDITEAIGLRQLAVSGAVTYDDRLILFKYVAAVGVERYGIFVRAIHRIEIDVLHVAERNALRFLLRIRYEIDSVSRHAVLFIYGIRRAVICIDDPPPDKSIAFLLPCGRV